MHNISHMQGVPHTSWLPAKHVTVMQLQSGHTQAVPAGIWCMNLINQHDVTICIFAKLVFGIHQQQSSFCCFFLPKLEEGQCSFAGLYSHINRPVTCDFKPLRLLNKLALSQIYTPSWLLPMTHPCPAQHIQAPSGSCKCGCGARISMLKSDMTDDQLVVYLIPILL